MERCEKVGCRRTAGMLVKLDAADGSWCWWACREHAEQFRLWVADETERQGGEWSSVQLEFIPAD